MSEQDAETDDSGADGSGTAAGTGASAESSESDGTADTAETVEDIAEEPEDPDAALESIVGEADGASGTDERSGVPDPSEVDVGEELLERVRAASPETTARGIALLRDRVDSLESQLETRETEVEDLESRLKRKQAEFQNYKKRRKERLEEEKQRATEDLVERLLDVRDNLARALDQDEDADIRGGVESTLRQFDEQLARENVEPIEPEPGEEVNPTRHEALATIASDQPEDAVAELHRPGYEMAGKILRPAQVAVSDGSLADDAGADDAGDGDGGDGDGDGGEEGA